MDIALYIIIGLLAGLLAGYLLGRLNGRGLLKAHSEQLLNNTKEMYDRQIASQQSQYDKQLSDQQSQYEKQLSDQQSQYEKQLSDQQGQYEKQLSDQKAQFDGQLADYRAQYEKQTEQLRQQQAEQLNTLRQQQAEQMQQQMHLIKEQMNTASERILRERSEQLSEQNKEQLSNILNPLKEGITQMKEAVEKSEREHADRMVHLDATIKTSIEQSREVGERADKLAQALIGENKAQGNFGELRLKQLLEDMGLEEGIQFEEQTTMKDSEGRTVHDDEDGSRKIPDVILHFPDKRDVIIDSKVSLKAFEDYHNAETEAEQQDALKRHIASVRSHVDELARKNYSSYIRDGRGRLDFVMMYVFSESALQLALTNAPTLWKEAYNKGVIISGSQTLYMMLRILEMTWRQLRQVENQHDMMKAANTIIDRVQLFYERFAKVDDMLNKTQEAFKEMKNISASSGKTIEVAARNLLKFGAQENPKRKHRISNDHSPQELPEGEGETGV